jgi:hypothetical protein
VKTIGVMGERTCDRVVAGAPSPSPTATRKRDSLATGKENENVERVSLQRNGGGRPHD